MPVPGEIRNLVGVARPPSRWYRITQAMIDAHAEMIQDDQWIHTDPARAAASPFGGTVAHGFLTLSLLSAMFYDIAPPLEGETHGVNYGFDRLRFLSPVPADARVRGHFTLQDVREGRPGELTFTWAVEVEIEGLDKPALAAVWINRHYVAA